MSLLLGLAFAALGLLALVAIVDSLRQSAPLIAELQGALKQPAPAEELRLTMHDAKLPDSERIPAPPPTPHRPKSIARLLQARKGFAEFA